MTAVKKTFLNPLCMLALVCWTGGAGAAECKLTQLASVPITTLAQGWMTVPVNISGTDYPFLLGLGDAYSGVDVDLEGPLKLQEMPLRYGIKAYALGRRITRTTVIPDLRIGTVHGQDVPMAFLPMRSSAEIKGMLGTDLLSKTDVEIDFKNNKLNLFSPDHCAGGGVYWSDTAANLPFTYNKLGAAIFTMALDGKWVTVALSSLISHSVMGMSDAHDVFGIDEHSPGMTAQAGPGALHRYPFKALWFGGVTVNNPDINLIPQTPQQQCNGQRVGGKTCYGGAQLTLGLAELRALHLYFAYGEHVLYVTSADAHR